MGESLHTKFMRWGFNLIPAYRGTGARVTYIASDWKEVRIRLPLSLRSRNYVGTIYGGSMYGAVDPIYMIMLIKLLGPAYIVWDKAASIRFKKPGRTPLFAAFCLDDKELEAIRAALEHEPSIDRVYRVDLTDAQGIVHATVDKTIYIKKKESRLTP